MISALVTRVAGLALQFLLSLLIAKALGQSGYGLWASLLALSAILSVVASFGMPPLLGRDLARKHGPESVAQLLIRHAKAALLLLIPASILLTLICTLVGNPLPIAFAGVVLLIPQVFAQFRQSAAVVFEPVSKALAPELIFAPLTTLALLGMTGGFSDRSLFAIIVGFGAGAMIASTLGSFKLLRHAFAVPVQAPIEVRQLLSEALPFFLAQFPRVLFANADILIIGMILGANDAGIYALTARVAALASLPLFVVNAGSQPLFAARFGPDSRGRPDDLAVAAAFSSFLGSMLVSAGLSLVGPLVLNLAGDGFAEGAGVLNILIAAHFANSAFGPNGLILLMSGHERTAAVGAWLQSFLTLGLTALFAVSGSVLAAACGVAISMIAGNILLSLLLYKRTGIALHPFANVVQRQLSWQILKR